MPPKKKINEWTVMFFCATDNELAPLIISQLKAIKDAGPHEDVDVLVYVDPNEKGIPTRVYCVNQNAIPRKPRARDPFVLNLDDDNIVIKGTGNAAKRLKKALKKPDSEEVNEALEGFLRFVKENHRAKHYALILLGHGMIVANDAFLPDESPVSSITLKQLGTTLNTFRGNLDLLALHSCSMSAVEVAYELKGKADYLMASEGLSFVGSWPYRQLLMRIFNFIDHSRRPNADPQEFTTPTLIESLYHLSFHNARDFLISGHSLDLSLCSLDKRRYSGLTTAIRRLVIELKRGLRDDTDKRPKRLIQLAHLESQSYFVENYSDLYDFCFLLAENCKSTNLSKIKNACEKVIEELKPKDRDTLLDKYKGIVVHSRHFGSQYQFSHGLSVYFPWSKPLGDVDNSVLKKYEKYEFTQALGDENSWLSFLNLYLEKTQRPPREDSTIATSKSTFVASGALPGGDHKPSGGSGVACSCPSIKNFATEQRIIKGKTQTVRTAVIARPNSNE